MARRCDYSRLERERQEDADVLRDFKEGLPLRKVCRLLGWTPKRVRYALFRGRLLGIQLVRGKFRPSKTGKAFERPWWTNYRYPAWQFEPEVRKTLPKILRLIRERLYTEDGIKKLKNFPYTFYKTAYLFLFAENHHFEGRKPIDLLRAGTPEANRAIAFNKKKI